MTSPLAERSVPAPVEPSRATWAAIIERARRDLPEAAFNLWFADLQPGDLKGDVFELIVPSTYVKNWLASHHMDLITGSVREVLGPGVKVRLKMERPKRGQQAAAREGADGPPETGGTEPSEGRAGAGHEQPTLDESLGPHSAFPDRYTFDTFVPGPSNKFAHAASLAVAEAPPSKAYNPVFIYGGVGLGKTHLLFAIANHMWRLSPLTRVQYVTSETFMTEFIKS